MIRVALVDGPLSAGHPGLVAQRFHRAGPGGGPAEAHALALAAAVLAACPAAGIENRVVFAGTLATDAVTVAEAIAASGAEVLLCAFGLGRDDAAIAEAVARKVAQGVTVVASAPARGAPVWPAACPGVISVQGDARCGPGEWSYLGLAAADFGAGPAIPSHPGVQGASAAAGHLAGVAAALRSAGCDPAAVRQSLVAKARWTGREHRVAAG